MDDFVAKLRANNYETRPRINDFVEKNRPNEYETRPRINEFSGKTRKKNYETGPRINDFVEKNRPNDYETGPRIDDFFEKNRKNQNCRRKPEGQQRSGFGGSSFCHEKIEVMLQIHSKTRYETRRSVSTELNNNIY